MSLLPAIGLLGGSFDPVHHGHLRSALDVCQSFNLASVHLLPNYQSPLKSTTYASNTHRLAMLTLASEDCSLLTVNPQELTTNQACFTVDTLTKLRQLHPSRPLCFLMGMDSLLSLTQWHRWQDILSLCHIVVSARPGWTPPTSGPIFDLLAQHKIDDHSVLHQQLFGAIVFHQAHPLSISSSEIRNLCREQRSCQYLVPDSVYQYIETNQLYRN